VTVPRRFEAEYRVRFDEADAGGRLRSSGFLRFAQDIAWQHSEAAGFGRDWYAERAMHWLVRDVDLQILAPVSYGDRLAVRTEVVGWRHVWARRRALVLRGDAIVAVVETDWVLLRTDGRPARLPIEMTALLASGQTFTRRRLELGRTPANPMRAAVTVRASDVDPMGHLNNAAYVDLVDEAAALLPADPSGPRERYQVSYLLPAPSGATVEVACWSGPDASIACRIQDQRGTELTRVLVGRLADVDEADYDASVGGAP
jgi:acyl-CoA thioesterase FadM